jgi:DNA-binding HxlR family transcriptional regulator
MSGYGQFCPVAKAMELLDERWTILVIRELMLGSRHFSALQRGLPRISPTLLSARLRTLVRAGVVDRHAEGNRISYSLTQAGQEQTDLRTLTEIWLGNLSWTAATKTGDLAVHASPSVRRAVPRWLTLSSFAAVPRPVVAAG